MPIRRSIIIGPVVAFISAAAALTMSGCADLLQKDHREMLELAEFRQPAQALRPRVWWHWMNGNITEEGIVADLEWMNRVGIGGVQNFDAAMATPVVVEQRLAYMSPGWKQAFRTAVEKADELGLEFAVASSAGWSLTGGPWVKPEDAMKKVVWTETVIEGGKYIEEYLPQPSGVPGPYQSLKAKYKHGHNPEVIPDTFYRDISVLAYPVNYPVGKMFPDKVYANDSLIDQRLILDDDLATGIDLPSGTSKKPGSLRVEYGTPQAVQSAVLYISNPPSGFMGGKLKPALQMLTADQKWQTIAEIELGETPTTVSFPPVSSRTFRLLLAKEKAPSVGQGFSIAPGVDPTGMMGLGALAPSKSLLADFQLLPQAKVHAFETKASYRHSDNYLEIDNPQDGELKGVDPDQVVDVSAYVSESGMLAWHAPAGNWKIVRLGYSLTGKTNSPATTEATGLEVDKYDDEAVARYITTYLDMYEAVVGQDLIGSRGLNALLMDSGESGPANWSQTLPEHFYRLRGYQILPWLPVLTGEIVGSREDSDRFLRDFRQTLGQLNATEHYQTVARIAQDRGLTVYGESLEGNREIATLGDDLELRRFADIPMGAMWAYRQGGEPSPHYLADLRGAASVAHIYGKKYVAAESLTSIMFPWAHAPSDLQPMIDAEFLQGVNRPVIHTSVHQPVDDKMPGLSLHVFGQYFTRHDTWAEMAGPWTDYLSRNSYMLQLGSNVADVAYFYGEEPPISVLASKHGYPADVPKQYAYDFMPADAVLHQLTVDRGDLVTRGGARYKVLFLGASSRHFISLELLNKMHDLVRAGATLVGLPPELPPAIGKDKAQYRALIEALWGQGELTRAGKGTVIAAQDVDSALAQIGVKPDFEAVVSGDPDPSKARVEFVHRATDDADIYMVANRSAETLRVDGVFRVGGKMAEIWRADTGEASLTSYRTHDGLTQVPLQMNPWESYFVVFRKAADVNQLEVATENVSVLGLIDNGWQLVFQQGRGAPDRMRMDSLTSLSEHHEHGIKYFSGITTYQNDFELPDSAGNKKIVVDLGRVADLAEIYVNGHYAGSAWKPPYHVNISEQVQQGQNHIEIRVANLWVNRLIGDRQPDVTDPVAYTSFKTYLPSAPLRPSGLLGPVKVLAVGN
jgi:hypothetical protein